MFDIKIRSFLFCIQNKHGAKNPLGASQPLYVRSLRVILFKEVSYSAINPEVQGGVVGQEQSQQHKHQPRGRVMHQQRQHQQAAAQHDAQHQYLRGF